MDESSFVDISDLASDGTLEWKAPAGNQKWRVFTLWEQYTNQRSCSGGVGADEVIANGSWTVDHFSKLGASRITDFWDQEILSDSEISDLLGKVGKYGKFEVFHNGRISIFYIAKSILTASSLGR